MLDNDDIDQICNLSEFELKTKLSDEDISDIICKKYKLNNASDVSLLRDSKREKIYKEISQIHGTSIRQIARVTKTTEYKIIKYLK